MREIKKSVYYCDHCRKHGLSRAAMAKHESVCTMNPLRVCRWKIDGHGTIRTSDISLALADRAREVANSAGPASRSRTVFAQEDIDWLRDEVDSCPACMLAALRQSGVDDFHWDDQSRLIFDYTAEVERLRREERAADQEQF